MRNAYRHAIETGYRFYSYGDASLLFRSNDMTTDTFQFKLLATDGKARRGEISMPRGDHPHTGLHAGRHRRHSQGNVSWIRCAIWAPISSWATPIT
jgi:hypothetical protein